MFRAIVDGKYKWRCDDCKALSETLEGMDHACLCSPSPCCQQALDKVKAEIASWRPNYHIKEDYDRGQLDASNYFIRIIDQVKGDTK